MYIKPYASYVNNANISNTKHYRLKLSVQKIIYELGNLRIERKNRSLLAGIKLTAFNPFYVSKPSISGVL